MNTKTKKEIEVRKSALTYCIGIKVIKKTYKGKEYKVDIRKDGFHFGKQVFPSLASVAMAITKKPYSTVKVNKIDGPRFFGLREERN